MTPDDAARLARDEAHRKRALDTGASFLVQAPAGSGKTELLIQRYLALLARVDSPQRVVAMTFTRKAASEMRERVIAALSAARDNVPVASAHARVTRDLAVAVLAQADRRGWSLLAHPAQLAVFTIDALCSMLARQAPLTSSLGAMPRIVERAEAMYAEAARATLEDADPSDPAWKRAFSRTSTTTRDRSSRCSCRCSRRREQWPVHVMAGDEAELRARVETALRAEIEAELAAARDRVDAPLAAAIARCAGRAAEVLRADGGDAELAAALERCVEQGGLPDGTFPDADWEIAAALLHVLPLAAAHLRITFARRGAVDFAELNAAATSALGSAESPSELLLRLDLAIDHLLVDEFQDTSDAQFRLVGLLTSGWQPGDGRTLFAVGDPMQSIYRFRDAEVRLFLRAIDEGRIGDVPVEFIDLTRNFRSQGALVAWTNRTFPDILGTRNEPWRGAVAFAAAAATHPEGAEGPPTLEVVATRDEEAARVVAHVRSALAREHPDIAILVRARADLEAILPALREAGIAFAAVELDALGARQAVQDVLALAHALIQPADRLAALSVLRAPWCGLVLADLFAVAERLREGLPGLFDALPAIEGVSADGRARLSRIAGVLGPAFAEHGRAPLADRVRGAWLAPAAPRRSTRTSTSARSTTSSASCAPRERRRRRRLAGREGRAGRASSRPPRRPSRRSRS